MCVVYTSIFLLSLLSDCDITNSPIDIITNVPLIYFVMLSEHLLLLLLLLLFGGGGGGGGGGEEEFLCLNFE